MACSLTLIAIDLISHRSFKSDCFRKTCKYLDGSKVTGQVERVEVCLCNVTYMSGFVHISFNLSVINYSLAFFSFKNIRI